MPPAIQSSASHNTWLERYEIVGQLGEGAYGVVYEALDRTSGERVALKELSRVNPGTLTRFKREFRAVQEVLHSNLVRLDGLFEAEGRWVIAMELVEGTDLLTHLYSAEGDTTFDEPQLRDRFAQLADGLHALHAAGLAHRDLKPSNVRVTAAGRVVVLDFGLATELDSRGPSTDAAVSALGTVAYMAPEQVTSANVGPAADWYAFGVCLYEALTGVLPIDAESPWALLTAKLNVTAAPVSSLVARVPEDLDRLCAALLQRDPAARPSGRHVSSLLLNRAHGVRSLVAQPAAGAAFEGRREELAQIDEAFDRALHGSYQVVMVEGESGIGKTTLVDHFIEICEAQSTVIHLRSRCYENELSAYKGFDGAVETLSRVLAQLEPAVCEALLPQRAALLCRLFPVMAEVKAIADAPLHGLPSDPNIQRLEAFSIFGRLLVGLSERTPILIVIDDLQWADAESFRLLLSLLRDCPPARCLILTTVRPRSELEADAADQIATLQQLKCVTKLRLQGLSRESARTLARELMSPQLPESWLELIVKESAGHPLFLTVLTRFAEGHDPKSGADLTLDAAIGADLASLSSSALRLLETAAVVGSPLAAPLCGRAAGLHESEIASLVAELCSRKLLRRRRAGEIACFHDRIRHVAARVLSAPQTKALHAEVAKVLATQGNADPSQLARHYEQAGELALAYEAYQHGAEKALSSFAFGQAALLYTRALEVSVYLQPGPAERAKLKVARAHALARGGRSAEAARQYLAAAEESEGADKTQLRIWAAQHLLQSACVEEGIAAARTLLADMGEPVPSGTAATVFHVMWNRACLALLRPRTRAVLNAVLTKRKPISLSARMRLDALWGIAMPVSWLDPLTSAALSTRHLRLARRLGEPTHMTRALVEEAFSRTLRDPDDREADRLLESARSLAATSGDPVLEVNVLFREATVATFRWDLPRALERAERAQQLAAESCRDEPWLLNNVRTNLSNTWANMGEHARLAAACASWLAEARDRNDQFAISVLEGLGFGTLRHLMADEPELGRQALDAALAPWPREPFSFAHYGELIGITYAAVYRGGDEAERWFVQEERRLARGLLLKRGLGRASLLMFRARASLAALRDADAARSQQLLGNAGAIMRKLRAVPSRLAVTNAMSLDAQLTAFSGDPALALQKTREVCALSTEQGYFFLARAFTYFEGLLEAGAAGQQKREAALAFFAKQGWKEPKRAVAIQCPVIDRLERMPR